MAYDQEEILILRTELDNLWQCLDNIASTENQIGEDQFKSLEETNKLLKLELSKIRDEHLLFQKVQLELCQWKTEVDQLTEESSGFQSERQLLIQTLDQVKTEHENLKLENLNLNNKNLQLLSHKEALEERLAEVLEVSHRQSDKIIALRSVAKALENENELLTRDNGRQMVKNREENGGTQDNIFLRFRLSELESELNAKEEERVGFMQCFESLQSEKMNLENKISELKHDYENVQRERDELKTTLVLSNDTLDALRQSKRLVENKFQTIVELSESQSRDLKSSNLEKICLQDQLSHKTANLEAIQQELELQATVYESTISEMQRELDKRLDEITASKDEDAEVIRERFVELFDEKARELNKVETDYSECKKLLDVANRRLVDSDYKEQELTELLHRKNTYTESERQVHEQVESLTKYSQDLETRLDHLKHQYEQLQTSYMRAVALFKAQLAESLQNTPPANQQEEQQLNQSTSEQVYNCDINCNNTEKTMSSKKKKKSGKKNRK